MSRYVALLDGHAGAYGVVVPDLPGCSSGGATIEEAVANTQEAVTLWVDEMAAQGGDITAPRDGEAVLADPEVADAVAAGAAHSRPADPGFRAADPGQHFARPRAA